MEKQLMDKIRSNTVDDIDKAMILARLKAAHSKLGGFIDDITEDLKKIYAFCEENKDEIRLLNFRLCFAVDDELMHSEKGSPHSGVPCICAYGASDEVKALIKALQEIVDN
jgi:hypothetical protein